MSKKEYTSPYLSVVLIEHENMLATSDNYNVDSNSSNGINDQWTNKKQQTDMWGNDPNKAGLPSNRLWVLQRVKARSSHTKDNIR